MSLVAAHSEIDPGVAFDDFAMDHALWETHIWPAIATRILQFEAMTVQNEWTGLCAMNTFDQNDITGPRDTLENFIFLNIFSGHGLHQSPAMGRSTVECLTYGEYRSLDLTPFHFDPIVADRPIQESAII